MSHITPSSWANKCVTCSFWRGSRKVSSSGPNVEWDDDKGQCMSGRFTGELKYGYDTCTSWKQWSVLRKSNR
jgi:hypothetical protein